MGWSVAGLVTGWQRLWRYLLGSTRRAQLSMSVDACVSIHAAQTVELVPESLQAQLSKLL
jgi:hypothetical protein